ncbi:sorbosone dehydrogenase, partial [Fulvimarina sp. 2208YS6-2-32]|nr:sorbosone dehydrogenase [Fulvimarina sp. 2208YS6-2-32]
MKNWLLASAAMLALTLTAGAQTPELPDNMEKLQGMQSTGTSMDFRTVEQTGEYADQLKKNLENINLPDGFK